ncbi:uncharacterized protein LOC135397704 [Ornithodoros turicata]|uniref:uncharacterized protein LOC135397704 n=1 Tax=Ornithodoros turicata TaxID=34597 RepID=UPI0031398774
MSTSWHHAVACVLFFCSLGLSNLGSVSGQQGIVSDEDDEDPFGHRGVDSQFRMPDVAGRAQRVQRNRKTFGGKPYEVQSHNYGHHVSEHHHKSVSIHHERRQNVHVFSQGTRSKNILPPGQALDAWQSQPAEGGLQTRRVQNSWKTHQMKGDRHVEMVKDIWQPQRFRVDGQQRVDGGSKPRSVKRGRQEKGKKGRPRKAKGNSQQQTVQADSKHWPVKGEKGNFKGIRPPRQIKRGGQQQRIRDVRLPWQLDGSGQQKNRMRNPKQDVGQGEASVKGGVKGGGQQRKGGQRLRPGRFGGQKGPVKGGWKQGKVPQKVKGLLQQRTLQMRHVKVDRQHRTFKGDWQERTSSGGFAPLQLNSEGGQRQLSVYQ